MTKCRMCRLGSLCSLHLSVWADDGWAMELPTAVASGFALLMVEILVARGHVAVLTRGVPPILH